jgi:hypothetical protein
MTGKRIKRLSALPGFVLLIAWVNIALGESTGDGAVTQLSLGRVLPDQPVKQIVTFNNPSGKTLAVEKIELTPPLTVRNITPVIEPGEQGQFTLMLGENRDLGEFKGDVRIKFEDNAIDPLTYHVVGFVVPSIEFRPRPVFYVATHRGEDKQASIEIIITVRSH